MSSSWWTLIRSRLPEPVGGLILPGPERYTRKPTSAAVRGFNMPLQMCTDGLRLSFIKEKRLWNSLTLLSKSSRPSLLPSVPVSAFGVPSTCWKVMVTTTPAPMLMYGREAQSKTRIASPATIPKSGERNRKIHSCMLYLISI